jgi:hypothetical protein
MEKELGRLAVVWELSEVKAWLARRATWYGAERAAQAALLRDIVGPLPFRPLTIAPSCLTLPVVALAQSVYDERAIHRLPELARALEAAGCSDAVLLEHLRSEGPHVRECFAVDAVLGRA